MIVVNRRLHSLTLNEFQTHFSTDPETEERGSQAEWGEVCRRPLNATVPRLAASRSTVFVVRKPPHYENRNKLS